MGTARMQIVEDSIGDVTVLRLTGRMILEEGEGPLKEHVEALVQKGRIKIVLDMRDVTRLDSAGIGMLVSKFVTVHRHGGVMKLLNLTSHTGRLMSVTKLTGVFECFESEDEALRSFATESV
jgi:anti-anti-sigma factor